MVLVSNMDGIDWTARGKERIAQNVRNLISTYRYEVAYHRTMGLPARIVDSPIDVAMEELVVEVWALIARYEPRARVRSVVCVPDESGQIRIEVMLE